MKKLNCDQVWNKVGVYIGDTSIPPIDDTDTDHGPLVLAMQSITKALVDSINENIDESWTGKTVCYIGQQMQVTEIFTDDKYKFESMEEFKCTKDYGATITVTNQGNTFCIPKEWVSIK